VSLASLPRYDEKVGLLKGAKMASPAQNKDGNSGILVYIPMIAVARILI